MLCHHLVMHSRISPPRLSQPRDHPGVPWNKICSLRWKPNCNKSHVTDNLNTAIPRFPLPSDSHALIVLIRGRKWSGKFVIHLGKLGFTCSGDHGRASQVALVAKNPPADAGGVRDVCVQSLGWQDPWRRAWQPTAVFLPGEPPWT